MLSLDSLMVIMFQMMHYWWDDMMGSWGLMPWMGPLMMVIGVAILVITSILIARYVYRDATRRHLTNADIWAVVTFFLNLFGLILYFLLRGGYPSPVGPVARPETPGKVESVTTSPNVPLEANPETTKTGRNFCQMCGSERSAGANFCTKCGAAFN